MVVKTKKNSGGIPAPAITIVARDSKTFRSWIGNSTDWCDNLKLGESVEDCIEKHTYNGSNILKDVLWGFPYPQQSLLSDKNVLISQDFTMQWQGIFFTLNIPKTMVADDDGELTDNSTRLTLVLDDTSGLIFQIFVHDPNFFEINYKPIFPGIFKTINPATDFNQLYNLVLTEVE